MKTKQFCAVIQDGNRITVFRSIQSAEKFRNNNGGFRVPGVFATEEAARANANTPSREILNGVEQ